MITIKDAVRKDCSAILDLIKELAEYEGLSHQVTGTAEDLEHVLFDEKLGRAVIGYDGDIPFAFCLYFYNISTFKCRKGIHIEDLYVKPEYRKSGIGTMLLQKVARTAMEENCGRVEWMCLEENTPAQQFYLSMGAEKLRDWELFRVDEEGFMKFTESKCSCHKNLPGKG